MFRTLAIGRNTRALSAQLHQEWRRRFSVQLLSLSQPTKEQSSCSSCVDPHAKYQPPSQHQQQQQVQKRHFFASTSINPVASFRGEEGSVLPQSGTVRTYVSRAHSVPRPVFAINHALTMLLEEAQARKDKRQAKADKYDRVIPHPDETIEIVFCLNLDPRKPGQTLRGNLSLPHGSGKRLKCVVFTNDEECAQNALDGGASHAGGEDLIEEIVRGNVSIEDMDRGLGMVEIMPSLSKKLARILGPRGLMPNPKTGTLHTDTNDLLKAMETQIMGKEIMYRTDKDGNVLVPVGKVSFGQEKLLENIGRVVQEMHEVKPENYGKGKTRTKSGARSKNIKYLLKVYASTTQGPGYKIDLRTVDPNSSFFLSDPDTFREALSKPAVVRSETEDDSSEATQEASA